MRVAKLGIALALAALCARGAAADQVIPDDLIVQGSLCTGLLCVNNESFGFDTVRLKGDVLRLQFTDILGVIKNVEVPDRQFAEALDGRIMFDGSSIEGFVRIEESDMYLKPDLSTFQIFPWSEVSAGSGGGSGTARVGRIICDVVNPDGTPFAGCPRTTLPGASRTRRSTRRS